MDYKILLEKVTEVMKYRQPVNLEGLNSIDKVEIISRFVLMQALLKCPTDVLNRLGMNHSVDDMISNDSLIHSVVDHPKFNCYMLMNTGTYDYS